MRDLGRVVAHIPARAGSKRVKAKNLRMLAGKPLLTYAINCAKNCMQFDAIYVNSDSNEMLSLASRMDVQAYKRSEELASDTASGDVFTIDFMRNVEVDTLVMISPVCPLISPQDVTNALDAFRNGDCDTLITCESTQMQTFCEGKPINIDLAEQLSPTQSNPYVQILNWAVTIWDVKSYIKNYELTGSAYIGKNRLLLPINPLHGIKISNEPDFILAESILRGLDNSSLNKY